MRNATNLARIGRLTGGGLVNTASGMGTGLDKTESAFFTPTRYYWRTPIEVLCVESWAARKAVTLPVRDSFLKRRKFTGASDDAIKAFKKALAMHRVDERVRDAMIAARQYGSSILLIMSQEAPMTEPLVPEQIRPGDLKALRVFNRYDASVQDREYDLFEPNYGRARMYRIHPNFGGRPMIVHHSRVIRFDGIADPGDSQFTNYEQDWGVSILVPIITTLLHEAGLAQSVAHLAQEASIPVLSVTNLRDAAAGGVGAGEMTVEEIGAQVNQVKSIFRLLMLEKGHEEFMRVAVQFGGLADLMDKSARRVSAAAEIPFSRFMEESAKGLNATGDGDWRNYVLTFEATRENTLPPVYGVLDPIVARSEGIREPPEPDGWPSLLDLSEKERAEVSKLKVEAATGAVQGGMIDEDEGREALNGDDTFGSLEGEAPGLPEPDPTALPGGPPKPGDPKPGGPPKPGGK